VISERHWDGVLLPRGAKEEVATRRYVSYDAGDVGLVERFGTLGYKGKRSFRVRRINECGGLVIIRRGIREWRGIYHNSHLQLEEVAPRPPAQIRPDDPPRREDDGKYIFLDGPAKTLDVHPIAAREIKRREHTPVTWLILEGSLKGDSALSGGLLSFSVPSVTLWNGESVARDMNEMRRYLERSPLTMVVTDADHLTNDKVLNQASQCIDWLDGLGLKVVHVAPAPLRGDGKTGIDDALGQATPLDQLLVVPRFPQFAPLFLSTSARELFLWLVGQGRQHVTAYPNRLGYALGMNRQTVWRATKELEKLGYITVQHGERFKAEEDHFDANPNRYTLKLPEPIPLAELGWDEWLLRANRPGRWTAALRKEREIAAERTLAAFRPPIQYNTCKECGKPIHRRRRTMSYCDQTCRKRFFRKRQSGTLNVTPMFERAERTKTGN
jgi:hypothetical protein